MKILSNYRFRRRRKKCSKVGQPGIAILLGLIEDPFGNVVLIILFNLLFKISYQTAWVFEDSSKTRLKSVIIVLKTSCAQMAQVFKWGLSDWHLLVRNLLLSFNHPKKGNKKSRKCYMLIQCYSRCFIIIIIMGKRKLSPFFFLSPFHFFSLFWVVADTCHKWSSKIISFKYNRLR